MNFLPLVCEKKRGSSLPLEMDVSFLGFQEEHMEIQRAPPAIVLLRPWGESLPQKKVLSG